MSNQTFPVIYGENHYLVDPNMLFNASRKFATLVQPFGTEAIHCQLVILPHSFTERSINNFLKLVQNLPTDVQDSEMKEICEIAKMFQADQIYNTGLNFVQSSIDPSFFVPDDKYEVGKQNLMLEAVGKFVHHLDDLEFDSEDDESYDKTSENKTTESKPKVDTVIYQIHVDRPMMKCNRYHFSRNGEILFSAKKKGNLIVIGKGVDIHLKSSTVNHCAQIQQEPMRNVIHVDGQTIILKYVVFEDSKAISMSVSFNHNNNQIYWFPKQPKLNPRTGNFSLKLTGAHHHRPLNSSKNSVMKNSSGHSTFITRLMGEDFFEAECHPDVPPAIVFSIALSSIIGPSINQMATE
ncbi:hypothetical protein M9Y10_031737 [Tritrichomonas musculus]|uniref:Tubby C-terminal domain-containing protein n=1 Tax=Tritrichomonas musculus TaxID=1915356 RepID=A0ABR2H0G4_9EUKA